MSKVKMFLKKNKFFVMIYENIFLLLDYISAFINCKKSEKQMTAIDYKKIKDLKGKYKGETCFIVGTAPSLEIQDLELIGKYKSFGVNSLYKIYSKTEWKPDFYVVMDEHAQEVLGDELYSSHVYENYFTNVLCKEKLPNQIKLVVNPAHYLLIDTVWNKLSKKLFPIARCSTDLSKVVYSGKTVVYAAIQIAMYMGFQKICLLGVDCDYSGSKKHASAVEYEQDDVVTDQRWKDNGRKMIMQFESLKESLPASIQILNASKNSKLAVFDKVNIVDL